MKIIAVIVTYNRLALLKKCIAGIQQQSRKLNEILIINNSSTDGTAEWLSTQEVSVVTQPNLGGAAGFSTGIKEAYKRGADWIWLMDDDTIADKSALEKLTNAIDVVEKVSPRIGFIAGNVLWTDGNPHLMNVPYTTDKPPIPALANTPYSLIDGATFVSLLVSRPAVEKTGLPIKEFFIWADDVEYTKRMIAAGWTGIFAADSIAIHETPTNYTSDIYEDSVKNLWKYKHGLRNELFIRKQYKSTGSFWRQIFKRMVIWPLHILRKRKTDRWAFIKTVWQSSAQAIDFHPPIEYVTDDSVNNR
jgi:GT2 family glycosyltransferase